MRRVLRRAVWGLMGVGLTLPARPAAAQRAAPLPPKEPVAAVSPSPDSAPAVLGACRAGQRDEFSGAALDRARWTTVVRETPALRIVDGHLVLPVTDTDIFLSGTAPNIVLQPLPRGPFVATAKLTLPARQQWQQAGLVVYGGDDNYAKLVLSAWGQTASKRVVQFYSEAKGEPSRMIRTDSLGAAFPDSVWVRLTSDGHFLRAAYSADGAHFTTLSEHRRDGRLERVYVDSIAPSKTGLLIGLLAMGGPPGIEAKFDWFELCRSVAIQGPRQ